MNLDLNGILKIQAVEKKTGKQINAVIENAFAQFSEAQIAESRSKILSAWGEEEEEFDAGDNGNDEDVIDVTESLPPELAGILAKAESKLNSASSEDQDEIVNLMEDIRDAFSEGRTEELNQFVKQLEDILYYID
jgi:molecular chaperone DnaK (HSP70)